MNYKSNFTNKLDDLTGWRTAEKEELRYISGYLYAKWSIYKHGLTFLSIFFIIFAVFFIVASFAVLIKFSKQIPTLTDILCTFMVIGLSILFSWVAYLPLSINLTNRALKHLLVQKKLSIRVLDVSICEVSSAKVLVRDMNNSQYAYALDFITYGKYIIPENGILIKPAHPSVKDGDCFVLPCYEEGSATDLQLKEFYKKYKPRRFVKK